MSRPLDEPTAADVDAVLRFLPLLERPDFDAGRFEAAGPADLPEGDADETDPAGPAGPPEPARAAHAPHFAASPAMLEFLQALQDHHFIHEFDWSEWLPVAERYVREPALLQGAGLGTVRKLFTTHLQHDRFHDGHLARVVESGHFLAVLRRLRELRESMK